MALNFDAGSTTSEYDWLADLVEKQILELGTTIPIESIQLVETGKGYLIKGNIDGVMAQDFCWKKSNNGKSLTAAFENPSELDDIELHLLCQNKVKNAGLVPSEKIGVKWILLGNELTCTYIPPEELLPKDAQTKTKTK